MPKMKTKKGAAKRFKVTKKGKVMARNAWGKHLFKSKSSARQMRLKGNTEITGADAKRVKRMLGE